MQAVESASTAEAPHPFLLFVNELFIGRSSSLGKVYLFRLARCPIECSVARPPLKLSLSSCTKCPKLQRERQRLWSMLTDSSRPKQIEMLPSRHLRAVEPRPLARQPLRTLHQDVSSPDDPMVCGAEFPMMEDPNRPRMLVLLLLAKLQQRPQARLECACWAK